MHIAFGRVRHKTSPTREGENVYLFFWFTIVLLQEGKHPIKNTPIHGEIPKQKHFPV